MSDGPIKPTNHRQGAKRRRSKRALTVEKSPFYIQAASPQEDEHNRVLKHGDTFGVFDHYGDIKPTGLGEEGLYHEGTRFLSCLLLGLNNARPLFLSSTVKEDNDLMAVDLTNPDVFADGAINTPRGTLHISRIKFIWQGVCYERIRIKNYGLSSVSAELFIHYEVDFADIFEVRGTKRKQRGQVLPPVKEQGSVILAYRGLDQVTRRTRLTFTPSPDVLDETEARFLITLQSKEETTLFVTTTCERDSNIPQAMIYDEALARAMSTLENSLAQACTIASTNEQFNAWVNRTVADLTMMTTDTGLGPYPYAGVPWFSTPFGRDGILTALECLWLQPSLARGVLAYLAATQAKEVIPEQDAEPGKIMHETRSGEMASLHEIPFGRYYGSIDATPLFVLLAGAYFRRTGNRDFLESIWTNVQAALQWIDTYGDPDRDGFVEYQRQSAHGLVQQGWKDSFDSIFHADGTLAQGPVALCEVQGYVYAAKQTAAYLATTLERHSLAKELLHQAQRLQEQFERVFWCEDLSTYALALDGDKRPCQVRTSNAGHCLFSGISRPEHARRVAQVLLRQESFSGWGIRTVASTEVRYNPMAYHNGSVWPHDNALIACGLARYGLKDEVLQVMSGLFEASIFLDLHRLPELFCGFVRRPGEGPTLYPVACAPQSWSAASIFMLLEACLGLEIDSLQSQICFTHPVLPPFLREMEIRNLRVGTGSVDLRLQRHAYDVGINVLRRNGNVEVRMVK